MVYLARLAETKLQLVHSLEKMLKCSPSEAEGQTTASFDFFWIDMVCYYCEAW